MTPETEAEEDSEENIDFKGPCFGQRHCLALLCCWLIGILYCMRVNLTVTIVVMVNNSAAADPSKGNGTSDECPVPKTNGTASITDGPFLWPRKLQGFILGAFFWGYLVLQLPGGTLSQRFGGKWILVSAVISNIILTAFTPVAAYFSPYLLIAARIIEGIFQGVTFPSIQAMLGRWVPPKEAGYVYAIACCGSAIGSVMGQLLSGQLCHSRWGWPSAFYVSALIAAIGLVPWLVFAYNSPEENPWISADELAYIQRHLGTGSQERSNRVGVPWLSIVTDKAIWAIIVALVCLNWVFYLILNCLPQYLSDVLHFDISADGILSSLPQIANIPIGIIAGFLSDLVVAKSFFRPIVARKSLYVVGSLGCVGCLCGVVFTGCNVIASVALLMMLMGFVGIAGVPIYANVAEVSPEFSGTIIGLANTFGTLPGFIAPIVTDDLTSHATREEWSKVFYIGSGIAIFGALFFLIFASSKLRKWNAEEEQEILIH